MIINRIILVVLMILTAVLTSIRGGTITYTLFYITWGIPILSIIYLAYVYARFKVYQSIDKLTLVKGEVVPYSFELANEDFVMYTGIKVTFFDGLSTVSEVPAEKSYSLTPGQSYKWDTSIRVEYKGKYRVGVEKVEVTDFLHLLKMTYGFSKTIMVDVAPRVPYFEHLVIPFEEYSDSQDSRRSDERFPDVELRKFISGDSIRAVNWKASARAGELFTRKYVDEANPEVFLLTDFSPSGKQGIERIILEDKIVEASLGIAHYLYQRNVTVNAASYNQKVSVFSKNGMDTFYKLCALTQFSARIDADRLFTKVAGVMEGTSQIILVTHTLSDKLVRQCEELAGRGRAIDIVYVGDDNLEKRLSADKKFRVTQITSEQEVGDVLDRKN